MTIAKPKRIRHSREAYAQLGARIIDALKRKPMTNDQLSAELKCSKNTVRNWLTVLMDSGQAHYVQVPTKGNVGTSHVWHLGPPPQGLVLRPAPNRKNPPKIANCRDLPTKQLTVRTFPAINRRDDLVQALFGPASFFASNATGTSSPIVDSAPASLVDIAPDAGDRLMAVNACGGGY